MYIWEIEVIMKDGSIDWRYVQTKTENWYTAEEMILKMPGVSEVGYHFRLQRPDGTIASC